jgi:hypothetical protein
MELALLRSTVRPRRRRNSVVRIARYLGLSVWFGGACAEAVVASRGGEQLAAEVRRRWAPVERVAVTGHLAGSTALGWAGRHRGWYQQGMPTAYLLDSAATVGALGATALREPQRRRLVPLLTLGSVLAQGFLPEQQRPAATVRRIRGLPRPRRPHDRHPVVRGLQDTGLALVFGGAALGVAALDPAGRCLEPAIRAQGGAAVAHRAWAGWMPVAGAGLLASGAGRALLARSERARTLRDPGERAAAGAQAVLAVAAAVALATSGGAGRVGRGARRLLVACAGGALVADALQAERQRPLTTLVAAARGAPPG